MVDYDFSNDDIMQSNMAAIVAILKIDPSLAALLGKLYTICSSR